MTLEKQRPANFRLHRFEWNLRGSNICGLFFADPAAVESLVGEILYMGEVIGKHSDLEWELEEDDVVAVDLDGGSLATVWNRRQELCIGHNLLDYHSCSDCGEPFKWVDGEWSHCCEEEA